MSYAAIIATAIGTDDSASLALVEDLMREGRSGLDGLSLTEITELARECFDDAKAWATIGPVGGHALADYCRVMGLEYPTL